MCAAFAQIELMRLQIEGHLPDVQTYGKIVAVDISCIALA